MKVKLARILGTFFGIGLTPKMPGTIGSLAGAAIFLGCILLTASITKTAILMAVVFSIVLILSAWTLPLVPTAFSGEHDPGEYVLDEVAGQLLTFMGVAGIPLVGNLQWEAVAVGFILFRVFDIWKPWVIGRIDRSGEISAILLDDLVSGGFGCLVLVGYVLLRDPDLLRMWTR